MDPIYKTLKKFVTEWSNEPIVPCLIGETGTGKTSRVLELGKELNIPVVRLLLSSVLPEEVLGLPRVMNQGENTITLWTIPEWVVSADGGILFLDEIDKAPQETTAVVLTLIADKVVRDKKINVRIVAAMQPPGDDFLMSETGKALSARFCFLPTSKKDSLKMLSQKYGIQDLNGVFDEKTNISIPILDEPSPRQIEFIIKNLAAESNDIIKTVLDGMLRQEYSEKLLKILSGGEFYLQRLVQIANESPEIIREMQWDDMGLLFTKGIDKINAKVLGNIYKRISLEATLEEVDKLHRLQAEYLYSIAKNGIADYTISEAEEVATVMKEVAEWQKALLKEKTSNNS